MTEPERFDAREQLITTEQDERRRLALFLHDGPVQTLAGVALMLDAVGYAIEQGRLEDARSILARALHQHRTVIRSLRQLSFNIEPVILRDRGIAAAVGELATDLGVEHAVRIEVEIAPAEQLAPKIQAGLYQIVREAVLAALQRRPPPTRISIRSDLDDGRLVITIADDAGRERRRMFFQVLEERVRALGGRVTFGHAAGTTIVLDLPAGPVEPESPAL